MAYQVTLALLLTFDGLNGDCCCDLRRPRRRRRWPFFMSISIRSSSVRCYADRQNGRNGRAVQERRRCLRFTWTSSSVSKPSAMNFSANRSSFAPRSHSTTSAPSESICAHTRVDQRCVVCHTLSRNKVSSYLILSLPFRIALRKLLNKKARQEVSHPEETAPTRCKSHHGIELSANSFCEGTKTDRLRRGGRGTYRENDYSSNARRSLTCSLCSSSDSRCARSCTQITLETFTQRSH